MPLELTIVTPEGERYASSVESVVLPGSEGRFGVLPGHERFLSPIEIGEVEIHEGARRRYAAVSEGFAEITAERAVILVEACELAEDIDVERAQRARDRRERELTELARSEAEEHRHRLARAGLQRAVTRLAVAGRR